MEELSMRLLLYLASLSFSVVVSFSRQLSESRVIDIASLTLGAAKHTLAGGKTQPINTKPTQRADHDTTL